MGSFKRQHLLPFLFAATIPYQLTMSPKIQSSPKCKAWEKFRRAAYGVYVSKKFFPQHSSWDEIWIFLG